MKKFKKILRWILGAVLLLLGVMGLIEFVTKGYDPQNEGIMLFGDTFKTFFNAMMETYLAVCIRLFHITIGILLFTKKYWWLGVLLHLPIAFNIFAIHIFHDIPIANTFFFVIGMFVSLSTFILIYLDKQHLQSIIISPKN